jgi:hypothetical protein
MKGSLCVTLCHEDIPRGFSVEKKKMSCFR